MSRNPMALALQRLVLAAALGLPVLGLPAFAASPYEVVKDHVVLAVAADGSYRETRQEAYRVLDASGVKILHERKLFYTQRFQSLEIAAAYTLKADGRRIDVPATGVVAGYGQASLQGFSDSHAISIFYPDLAPGDQVVLETRLKQLTPWFPGAFDIRAIFSRTVASHDVVYEVSYPAGMTLHFDVFGLDGGEERDQDGRSTRIWRYDNDTPVPQEIDAVSEADFAPHLGVSSFADYAAVARAYRERAKDSAVPSKEIAALAAKLTKGVADKREMARRLYEWVSANIDYVAIELGAGGFSPNSAVQVLRNRSGDCKDHVALLEALLAARGIASSAALINAGSNAYRLPVAATPHAFNHVITYLPAFDLYVDAAAKLAPFGVLPYADAGKPVLLAADGKVAQTPVATAASSAIHSTATLALQADGSAEGNAVLSAAGAYGVQLRALMRSVGPEREKAFLHMLLGSNAEGKIARGDPMSLQDPYIVTVSYRLPGVIALPGPGALPALLSPRPYRFVELIGGRLPVERGSDYVCPSLTAEDEVTLTLPSGATFLSVPASKAVETGEIRLWTDYQRREPRTLVQTISLKIDHPQASCTPDYYDDVRDDLQSMIGLIRRQVIFQGEQPARR
jgi:transglutaminase-like putative cysteine protease